MKHTTTIENDTFEVILKLGTFYNTFPAPTALAIATDVTMKLARDVCDLKTLNEPSAEAAKALAILAPLPPPQALKVASAAVEVLTAEVLAEL